MDEFKALNCVRLTVRALKITRREKTRGSTKVDSLPPPHTHVGARRLGSILVHREGQGVSPMPGVHLSSRSLEHLSETI